MRLGVFLVHFFGVVTFFSCHSPIRLIPFLPISGVIIIYMADIGEPDILLQIFYLSILRLICNSLSKAMAPIVYPYTFLSQGVSLRRAVQKPDRK